MNIKGYLEAELNNDIYRIEWYSNNDPIHIKITGPNYIRELSFNKKYLLEDTLTNLSKAFRDQIRDYGEEAISGTDEEWNRCIEIHNHNLKHIWDCNPIWNGSPKQLFQIIRDGTQYWMVSDKSDEHDLLMARDYPNAIKEFIARFPDEDHDSLYRVEKTFPFVYQLYSVNYLHTLKMRLEKDNNGVWHAIGDNFRSENYNGVKADMHAMDIELTGNPYEYDPYTTYRDGTFWGDLSGRIIDIMQQRHYDIHMDRWGLVQPHMEEIADWENYLRKHSLND